MMNRITVEEFDALPDHEQYEILGKAGNFVEFRESENVSYELYAVDRFFVEVSYKKKEYVMIGLQAFNTGTKLDPYSSDMKTLLTGILRN